MFYQYPWWRYYGGFSEYVSRLSHLLSGGRHVADVAIIWPINAMFAVYRPQERTPLGERIEHDFNALTELFLRIHRDYDYLDESLLAAAPAENGRLVVGDEHHALVVVPPMAHIQLATLDRLERFVAEGGRVMGAVLLPGETFGEDGLVDVRERVGRLFGVEPERVGKIDPEARLGVVEREHPGGGRTAFVTAASLSRGLPEARQRELRQPGVPESDRFVVEPQESGETRYLLTMEDGSTVDIGEEVEAERRRIRETVAGAVGTLIGPDVTVSNPEVLYLHRVNDDQGPRVPRQLHARASGGGDRRFGGRAARALGSVHRQGDADRPVARRGRTHDLRSGARAGRVGVRRPSGGRRHAGG